MSSESTPPDDGEDHEIDPFEAELVAYLDGELDAEAARKIEARLAADPDARGRAAALKETFGLLDYLPRTEPSPTFATRTLERLPVVPPPATRSGSQPTPVAAPSPSGATSGVVTPALSGSGSQFLAPPPSSWGRWAAGLVAAVCACGAAGYFASGALHAHLHPGYAQRDGTSQELDVADHAIVERLPLYAGADDLDFVNELAKGEFFGDEPAVLVDLATKPPAVEPDKPSGAAFARLATTFRALPAARQQAIRDLDRQLRGLDGPTRDQRYRVLEAYTIWLDRLPEPERKQVLAADTARRRLDEVRKLRNQQWLDALTASQRAKLNGLPASGQADLIRQWREEEQAHREEWAFYRTYADDVIANKTPWPFDSSSRQKEVAEFVRTAFRLDDEKLRRLEDGERVRYAASLALATEQGGWMPWYAYGRNVYAAAKKYERFLLPEPATGEPVTRYEQLGPRVERFFEKGRGRSATQNHVGKWPDFALAVNAYATSEKGDKIPPPVLGPARPAEFKEPLRHFVTRELIPALPPGDRKALEALEGKWPEYPNAVVRLARQCDLSAPGLMLPGSPKRWDAMYGGLGPRVKGIN
ncbi:anti-sigma factor family protein [Gemmata sp.]|uniref:anti-sigma factor family protein n=1 Tax=Gemmata sp. TaxID=1914242 RepID=UPI003F6FA777